MPKIKFIAADGAQFEGEGAVGETLMEVGRTLGVPDILAECGGAMACATCQVLVDPRWLDIVGRAGPDEEMMLEFGSDLQENSRLSCQVELTEAMDGLVVRVPEVQG
ncbi:MAG: 2Fe-2S iron-sulfur cluster-binding protein [Maritimibacter sp.]